MIRSFRSKALSRYWLQGKSQGLTADHVKRLRRRLLSLDDAASPEDMNTPGAFFHPLTGDMAGRYAVRVTGNWRLTFAWDGSDAVDVDYEDYH